MGGHPSPGQISDAGSLPGTDYTYADDTLTEFRNLFALRYRTCSRATITKNQAPRGWLGTPTVVGKATSASASPCLSCSPSAAKLASRGPECPHLDAWAVELDVGA